MFNLLYKPTNKLPMAKDSMLLITSEWGDNKSFRLIPITNDCPYVEGIYDPIEKVLVIISKIRKQTFHMVAKLDEQGDPQKLKKQRVNMKPFPEERKIVDTYQEYYITETEEINSMIQKLAENSSTFDFAKYMHTPAVTAKVAEPVEG